MLEKIEEFIVSPRSEVKVTSMGNIIEKMYLSRRNTEATCIRLPDNKFFICRTGEIKDIKPMEVRTDNKNSLKKSMRRLRNLLNANIDDVSKCRWVTLTYAENMTDTVKLYEDFKKFNMRMKYYCEKNGLGNYEYIVAMEPQGRGAWHAHVVLIFDRKAPFISNEDLANVWLHGFVKIKKLDDVDNVGAYLTAYLGDMELEDTIKNQGLDQVQGKEIKTVEYIENGETKSKYYVKGARLSMYPAKFNLYRNSRGCKQPEEMMMTENEAIKKVSDATLTFSNTSLFTDPKDGFSCVIDKKYYNTKRLQNQESVKNNDGGVL